MKNIFETIERNPVPVVIGLLFFHIIFAGLVSWIAHSSFLIQLHNMDLEENYLPGREHFWNFARDSIVFHLEAIDLVDAINSGAWGDWWSSSYGERQIGHPHVKWIALVYWLFGEENPFYFELINSVTWVASVVLIYLSARILFSQNVMVACFATSYLFFPSIILSSTQLLRDPFYVLGICGMIFGWVAIFNKDLKWKGALAIIISFLLLISIREYITPLLWSTFFICTVIFLLMRSIDGLPGLIMLMGISIISYQEGFLKVPAVNFVDNNSSIDETKAKERPKDNKAKESTQSFLGFAQEMWKVAGDDSMTEGFNKLREFKNEGPVLGMALSKFVLLEPIKYDGALGYISYLNKKLAIRLSLVRFGFRIENRYANSILDPNAQFMNIRELIAYLPRALQIGFLSPFPNLWVSRGTETGNLGRMMAGLETLVVYVVLIGFVAVLFMEIQILKSIAPILVFSGIIIILLGYAVPNVGAIYRMRQGFIIPFFMLGVFGLNLIFIKLKSKMSKN